MIFVEHVQVDQPLRRGPGYAVEASTLGLKPGNWPAVLSALDAAGEPFELRRSKPALKISEIVGYLYEGGGYHVTVFND